MHALASKQPNLGDPVNRTISTGITHSNEKPDLELGGGGGADCGEEGENDCNAMNIRRILDSSIAMDGLKSDTKNQKSSSLFKF